MTLTFPKCRIATTACLALFVLAAIIVTDTAWAAAVGDEFLVNTYTTDNQDRISVGVH